MGRGKINGLVGSVMIGIGFALAIYVVVMVVVGPAAPRAETSSSQLRQRSACPCPAAVRAHMHPDGSRPTDALYWQDVCGATQAMSVEITYTGSSLGQPSYRVEARMNGQRDFRVESLIAIPFMAEIEAQRLFGASDEQQERFLEMFATTVGARVFFERTNHELICEDRSLSNVGRLP